MRCRNFVDGEVVWFGSKGIKSQDTQYQEIDITNGGNIEGLTANNQRFKIKGNNQKEWSINFFDEYGTKKYFISTKELPLRELPQLSYNLNYSFSWDKTLAQVNSMTNGGNVKTIVTSNYNITELIPVEEGFPIGNFNFVITNKENESITLEIRYPSDVSSTYITLNANETKSITKNFEYIYKAPIYILAINDKEYYLGSNDEDGLNFYDNYSGAGNQNFNSMKSIKEIRVASNTYIGIQAFSYYSSTEESRPALEKILIAEGSTTLGSRAFADCINLQSINLPNSIILVGNTMSDNTYGCFEACESLKSAVYGNNTIYSGDFMFNLCEQLEDVILGSSVQHITDYMFRGNYALKNIELSNVIDIGNGAFEECISLETIELPSSLSFLGTRIFSLCKNLKHITMPYTNGTDSSIMHFGGFFFVSTQDPESIFEDIDDYIKLHEGSWYFLIPKTLVSVTIIKGSYDVENNVETYKIEKDQFKDMTMLREISVGEDVNEIEEDAFLNCTGLTFLVVENENITIDANAFRGCDNLLKGFYGDIQQCDVVLYNGLDKVAYIQLSGEYDGILTRPITSVAIYNHLYDDITLYLYPKTQKNSAENFVGEQSGVASALNQLLSVIRGELWFATNTGLPLFDKVSSKIQMDATVLQIVNSQADVIAIKSFESYIQGHSYSCKIEIVSKYGDLTISI